MIADIIEGKLDRHGPEAPLSVLCPRAYGIAAVLKQEAEPVLYADEPPFAVIVARREAWMQLLEARRVRTHRQAEIAGVRRLLQAGPTEGGAA